MGDPKNSGIGSENTYHCAYNFPAVLLTLGPSKWDDSLKTLYFSLLKDTQWRVRRTLSFSIHEIAKIIGPAKSKLELLPLVENLLKDTNDV